MKLGLLINPIAGMGGKTALKGTDGRKTLERAIALGAVPEAGRKAERALLRLSGVKEEIEFLTCAGAMGEESLKRLGFSFREVYRPNAGGGFAFKTMPEDTIQGARAAVKAGAELLLFAGGDGTARDVYRAVGQSVPVIGIPAGVKIQSAVFAFSPEAAGNLAASLVKRQADESLGNTVLREVVDLDEDEYRTGHVSARIYGTMRVPERRSCFQSMKQGGFSRERETLAGIGAYTAEHMEKGVFYAIGSGTTAKCVSSCLGIDSELLGVDLVMDRKLIKKDVTERELWELTEGKKLRIIVSPIGGQGFLFGRGNHQFSPRILRKAGKEGIIVVSPVEKLMSIQDGSLKIDCGDEKLCAGLCGYYNVISGYGRFYSFPCRNPG